ncbi:MAG TPA: DUF1566 domain-containing protein, partial [Turneriella sp.]|nr:DUF1566 domain-containing protein [Turneriella sp.]
YCFRYDLISGKWIEETACRDQTNSGGGLIGTYNYPAGQNGFLEPRNEEYGPTIYGAASSIINGRRFRKDQNPLNLPPTGCTGGGNDACYPYTLDSKTNLIWRTCSQGQYYNSVSGGGTLCGPTSGADYTWGDAVNACAALNNAANGTGYAGRRDWRLPTIEELENLVDFGARITKSTTMPEPNPGYPEVPALDTYQETVWPLNSEGAFPNTPINKGYWTATGVTMLFSGQVLYNQAYTVEFKKGSTGPGPGSNPLLNNKRDPSDFANRNKVRCVAGPLVAPTPPTLTPSTVAASAVLVGNAATFTAPDGGASFNVKSVKPVYNIENNKSTVIVEYDKVPDSTQASTAANYCIAPANAVACGPSSPLVTTIAQVTGNTSAFELTLQTYMGSNTAYKIFVSNVQTKSNQWQTGVNYGVNQFVTDSGNVYRAANAHLSTTIAADVGAGDLVLLNNLVTGTTYSTVG